VKLRQEGLTPRAAQLPIQGLFEPFRVNGLLLPNRLVMPPMGRHFVQDGVPSECYIDYFRQRAQSGLGLLITVVSAVNHPVAQAHPGYARMHGADALSVYARIVESVHAVGGRIIPQLVHCGTVRERGAGPNTHLSPLGPSGLYLGFGGVTPEPVAVAAPATPAEIDAVIEGFARSATQAARAGFDGIEIHGAHGYLIDQFFWKKLNRRSDRFGGDMSGRGYLAVQIVRACRDAVGAQLPIFFRWSQWKQQDYAARLCHTPQELARFLEPLAASSIDVFDCSTRRVWEPEFPGSALNAAGWTRKLTGKPTVTVGSIILDYDPLPSSVGDESRAGAFDPKARPRSIDHVLGMLDRGECDLVAIGRGSIANPRCATHIRNEAWDELGRYTPRLLETLC